MLNISELIGRTKELFIADSKRVLPDMVKETAILVIGGAGSIGQAVVKNLFMRAPRKLHVVDINENNLVELVRDIRSSLGYTCRNFKTFAIDCGSGEYECMMDIEGPYDYVLNLSAMKHVRSEKDPFSLMRMVHVNILNTIKTIDLARSHGTKKYFCVSTDKASSPVNMMGASKRIMEAFLMQKSREIPISTARFANVAFSDGSLPYGFIQRLQKRQPISAPRDIMRYFITPQESGTLCVLSALLGENRDIYFPKLTSRIDEMSFVDLAVRFLHAHGYEPLECGSEDEAREQAHTAIDAGRWPCYFFISDTTGEKKHEEFFSEEEKLDVDTYEDIGVVKKTDEIDEKSLAGFLANIEKMVKTHTWTREQLIKLFSDTLLSFSHLETGKFLDNRM
jgi:FlaA1/EpsC-like NDP-sugar epimerase